MQILQRTADNVQYTKIQHFSSPTQHDTNGGTFY
jgi:hypothetical protein